jgi:Bacterial regulatory proteins, luxR family
VITLLDRKHELEVIEGWLAGVDGGGGRVSIVRGGAGIGKTALLGQACRLAGESGFRLLAAGGLSNREIAHQPFVSRKTVESHLGHVYSKLDIGSRKDLPTALDS